MPAIIESSAGRAQTIPSKPGVEMHRPRPGIGLLLERFLPWACAIAVFLITREKMQVWILHADWADKLLDRVVAACSVFVAYLATALTILPAISEKVIIQRLKDWGYFHFLIEYFSGAIWSSSLLLLMSLAVSPISAAFHQSVAVDRYYSAAWWAVMAFAIIAIFRSIRILIKAVVAR